MGHQRLAHEAGRRNRVCGDAVSAVWSWVQVATAFNDQLAFEILAMKLGTSRNRVCGDAVSAVWSWVQVATAFNDQLAFEILAMKLGTSRNRFCNDAADAVWSWVQVATAFVMMRRLGLYRPWRRRRATVHQLERAELINFRVLNSLVAALDQTRNFVFAALRHVCEILIEFT